MVRPRIFGNQNRATAPPPREGHHEVDSQRILDEKQGLANGQPTIHIADSLHFYQTVFLDEHFGPGSRGTPEFLVVTPG